MAKSEKRVERLIGEVLKSHNNGLPGLQVIRLVQQQGVERGAVSRAIAHAVARGDLILDGQHRLSAQSRVTRE